MSSWPGIKARSISRRFSFARRAVYPIVSCGGGYRGQVFNSIRHFFRVASDFELKSTAVGVRVDRSRVSKVSNSWAAESWCFPPTTIRV